MPPPGGGQQTWEMLLAEALTWIVPLTEFAFVLKVFGPHAGASAC